jgi:hypothetical protein
MIGAFLVTIAAAVSALALTGATTVALGVPARGSTRPASAETTASPRGQPMSPDAVDAAFTIWEQREARTLPRVTASCGWENSSLDRYSCVIGVWRHLPRPTHPGHIPAPVPTKIYSQRTIEIDCTPSNRCPTLPRPPWLNVPRCWYRAELRNGQWVDINICRSGLRELFAAAS